ncbi:MAG: phospholipase D-like domain-containing protein [Gemmatimonadota bacterium]|nr:phospholipase D-like domain-containing protein [Gemmatimonadota bacterium]
MNRNNAGREPRRHRVRKILKYISLGLLAIVVLLFAMIGLLYSLRGTPVERVVGMGGRGKVPAIADPEFRQSMSLLTGTPLVAGNTVDIMINGDETYPKLWADLRAAKRTLTIQMYYCSPGRMATQMKDILLERARAGVRVLFLYDAFGAGPLSSEYLDSLKTGGIELAGFRPVKWYELHKAQSRSHIRVVVADGHIGYTGGFGLDDKWFGDGRHKDQWRDSNVRLTGPAVLQLQATFAEGWAEATGELLTGELFFPLEKFEENSERLAGVMHTAPTIGSTPAERFFALSIASARKTLYITNSYFVPDDDFRELMKKAAARGVDVRILTAGPTTDVKTTWYAGRHRYEELLAAGVKIYEYQPVMMHAKSLVADGLWSSVGTMNFDNRSLAFNDESNLNSWDLITGAKMDSIFLEDLKYSKEMKLEEFRRRAWTGKLLEIGANLLSRLL